LTGFAEVVATSSAVGSTGSRTAKITALAELLRRLQPDEVVPTVGFLTGEVRQGRIGIGWATLSKVMELRGDTPLLSIGEVDAAVEVLAGTSGPGSVGRRHDQLAGLFGRATAEEADFLVRLLGGELRQGALAGVMTDAVARAAGVPLAAVRRAMMLSGDLAGTAAIALTEGVDGLSAVHLAVLRPVQPMLAATATDLAEAMASTGEASVEWKLDGARVQVHRHGDQVRIFTRNLNEVTDRLGGVVAAARALPAEHFVLDGEVLHHDDTDRPQAFQEIMSRFGRQRGEDGGDLLVAAFFDVLHVDGEDLLDEPLRERLVRLDALVGGLAVPRVVTADVDEALALQTEALARGHEGVMVKAIDSPYEAGRRGSAWRKVKPVRTLDLMVLAAEWGHGRRRGKLSNLHLGARGPDGDFVMVGKTFKGLTDELLAWQTDELLARKVEQQGITVHVRPELVVEIALDGVQASTRYPGGVALRFARVRGYRPDKDPADVDTIETVQALRGPGPDEG
jgi:DNA ligase-1